MINLERIPYIIIAAMVLHNICIDERDEINTSDDSDFDGSEADDDEESEDQRRVTSTNEDQDDDLEIILPEGDVRTNHKAHAYREHLTSIL